MCILTRVSIPAGTLEIKLAQGGLVHLGSALGLVVSRGRRSRRTHLLFLFLLFMMSLFLHPVLCLSLCLSLFSPISWMILVLHQKGMCQWGGLLYTNKGEISSLFSPSHLNLSPSFQSSTFTRCKWKFDFPQNRLDFLDFLYSLTFSRVLRERERKRASFSFSCFPSAGSAWETRP